MHQETDILGKFHDVPKTRKQLSSTPHTLSLAPTSERQEKRKKDGTV